MIKSILGSQMFDCFIQEKQNTQNRQMSLFENEANDMWNIDNNLKLSCTTCKSQIASHSDVYFFHSSPYCRNCLPTKSKKSTKFLPYLHSLHLLITYFTSQLKHSFETSLIPNYHLPKQTFRCCKLNHAVKQ